VPGNFNRPKAMAERIAAVWVKSTSGAYIRLAGRSYRYIGRSEQVAIVRQAGRCSSLTMTAAGPGSVIRCSESAPEKQPTPNASSALTRACTTYEQSSDYPSELIYSSTCAIETSPVILRLTALQQIATSSSLGRRVTPTVWPT
jgi:hypothetical protein